LDKRKTWKCDFKNCSEIAEYYRLVKGNPVKVCLHHEVHMRKQRIGKHIEYFQLNPDDIQYLIEKDNEGDE
jgi:hypothetical protein